MYVVCVLCDVGRHHAVAFRAGRRRRHVFVFLGVCIIRTSACVRVCAVCMHVHDCVYARSCVCAHATTSSSRARLRRHVGRMCRVSPSAIHHMPRRRVVVRVGARP